MAAAVLPEVARLPVWEEALEVSEPEREAEPRLVWEEEQERLWERARQVAKRAQFRPQPWARCQKCGCQKFRS